MPKPIFKSFSYKAIHIIVLTLYSIFLIPVLLTYWDLELYGTWIALYAFFNLIQVFELGHSIYIGNEFNRVIHTNVDQAKTVLGSALRANVLAGFLQIGLVVLLYLLGFFTIIFDDTVDIDEVFYVLTILLSYKLVMGSFRGVLVKLLNPFGLIYKSFQFALVEKILEFFILIFVAVFNIGLIELAIIWFCTKFVYSGIVIFSIKQILPDYYPWWRYGTFNLGVTNFIKSLSFGASNFLDRLGNDGIVLVLSAFVGSTFLPLFAATRTIVNFGLKLSEFFLNPLTPEIINLYAKNKLNKIRDVFRSYWFITGVLLMVGFTVSLLFIEDLFTFWTNGKLSFNLALYSSLIIIFLVQNYGKMIVTFFTGINKTRVVLLTSVIRISLFFLIAFMFKDYGLYGVLLGMFVSELIVVSFWLPYHSFNEFSIKNFEKVVYMLNLFTVLYLAVIFYLHYLHTDYWILGILLLPVAALLYYQYTRISAETRAMISNSLGKLTTFVPKKRKNAK